MGDESDGNTLHTPLSKFPKESNEEPEPEFTVDNKEKLDHFRRLGIFLVYWKKGKYEASQEKMLISYIIWYLVVGCTFSLAYMFKELFKRNNNNYIDRVDDLIEASFVGILLGVIPAFWIYLLREYNTNLPRILMKTSKLEKDDIYKKMKSSKEKSSKEKSSKEKSSKENNFEISYKEGWLEDDHNDSDDEESRAAQTALQNHWGIVKYGPYVGFILSVSVCFILIIISFFWDISIFILETPEGPLKHVKRELPFFIMAVLYPIPYFVSIWFCILFLEWQRTIHECARYLIRNIKNKYHIRNIKNLIVKNDDGTILKYEDKNELKNIGFMLNKVQKVFILLNKKIFQKTIVIDFTVFIFLGIFCCWKCLQDPSNFAYGIPLSLIFGHIYFICSWSNALMNEFNETNEVLNEFGESIEEYSDKPKEELEVLENLRKKLKKYPPQVMGFGGFSVNYNMMTAVLAFIISCVGIPEEMWPEANKHCYTYVRGGGEWEPNNTREWNTNDTLCFKQKLLIGVNETLTLKKKCED